MGARRGTVAERLARNSRFDPDTGCRVWIGKNAVRGYGRLKVDGEGVLAHRAAWEEENGPIPVGMCVLHDCPAGDDPACINVDHLWLGTNAENNADMMAKGRWGKGDNCGSKHGHAKIVEADVVAIRLDNRVYREIGADFGIAPSTICNIKSRKAWGHVA